MAGCDSTACSGFDRTALGAELGTSFSWTDLTRDSLASSVTESLPPPLFLHLITNTLRWPTLSRPQPSCPLPSLAFLGWLLKAFEWTPWTWQGLSGEAMNALLLDHHLPGTYSQLDGEGSIKVD